MTVEKAREFNAEAVFIVSNPKMAYHVSNYVIKQGIPVFASNFDVWGDMRWTALLLLQTTFEDEVDGLCSLLFWWKCILFSVGFYIDF